MSPVNSVPYEVIAAPYTVYVAAVGAAFPDVAEDPDPGIWTKVGTSGALNYDDGAGVTVEHAQTLSPWRSLGDAGSRKVFRTEEDLKVKLRLVDLTPEQYAMALNRNTVTDVAGVPATSTGYRKLGLSRGFGVATMALLIRGNVSPLGEGETESWHSQYEIPIAVQTGSPSVVLLKKEPAGLDLEWMALVDPSAASEDERFGRLVVQDAEAS